MKQKKYKDAYRLGKRITKGKYRRYVWVVALIVAVWFIYDYYTLANKDLAKNENVALRKCTDGDTAHFTIDGQDEKVRFLAIDTPESVKANTPVQPYGKEASDYTCKLLSNAATITLEFEEERSDQYGRLLAWVFVDGELLQEKLIEHGLAQVKYIFDDYKYTQRLKQAQRQAEAAQIGIFALP